MATHLCLIVDDEPAVRSYLRTLFEQRGWKIIEAGNGADGFDLVHRMGDALDLIVSDVCMPGGDGLALACAARESLPAVPIILMSGYSEPEKKDYPRTPIEFLSKPFQPAALWMAVDRATEAMRIRRRAGA